MKLRKYDQLQLREAVKNSTSLRQVLEVLGVAPYGGNYEVLRRAIRHFGLETSHFTGQRWNKGKTVGPKQPLERFLNNASKRDFTEEQQAALLDQANWTVRTGIKLDNLLAVLYGEVWINGEMDFDPDDLEGKEFIAKVHPKTGKKPGSYTGWETYMSINPPKKKKSKLQDAQEEAADAADTPALEHAAQDRTEAEWTQAKEAVR